MRTLTKLALMACVLLGSACGNAIAELEDIDHDALTVGSVCPDWVYVPDGSGPGPGVAFADSHTGHWIWGFLASPATATMELKIEGYFPHARFSVLQSYNGSDPPVVLNDNQIVPNGACADPSDDPQNGCVNPPEGASFTAWLVPPGSPRAGAPNVLVWRPGTTQNPSLMWRVGRSDQACSSQDGCVPLPKITAYRAGQPVQCPALATSLPSAGPSAEDPEERVIFYRWLNTTINTDVGMLYTELYPSSQDHVAAIRFKIPTFPNTYCSSVPITGNEDVRYTGLCVSGESSVTTSCLCDDQWRRQQTPAGDFANIVIGPENQMLRQQAESRGYDYMTWGALNQPAVLFRQKDPRGDCNPATPGVDFAGSAKCVPPGTAATLLNMGAYAPMGCHCPIDCFLSGQSCPICDGEQLDHHCGLPDLFGQSPTPTCSGP